MVLLRHASLYALLCADRRPDDVVAGHKRRAVALWVLLIGLILAYASWQFATAVEKRDHPGTSLILSNTVYAYPDVWVCLYDTFGCDTQGQEEKCLNSATMTEGGHASAVFYPDGEYEQEVPGIGTLTDGKGWCLEYKTSQVTTFLEQERNAENYLDYFILNASWYPGGGAGNSTTCVPDGEKWKSHSEWVYIFLHDPETNVLSTGIQTSYTCVTSESNSHTFTYMGIGLNKERNIKRDDVASYKALSLTSSVRKDEVNGNVTHPYAYLEVQIQQEPDSLEVVTEIDPLDVGEILGSIGGFWDLILILWPIFFVAATRQDPHLKPRDFKRSADRVAGVAGFVGVTASRQGPMNKTERGSAQSVIQADLKEVQTEHAYWETTAPDTHPVYPLEDV